MLISTFSPLQIRESNYNQNVAHCFMSLEFEQRLLGIEVEGVRASSHCRENLSSGLDCLWYTLQTPRSWTVPGRVWTKLTPLGFFCFPFSFWLRNSFFSRYVNILKQILLICPGSYLLRWLCVCLDFYGSNADGSLISLIINFLEDTSCYYLTCHVVCIWVGETDVKTQGKITVFWRKKDVCCCLKK